MEYLKNLMRFVFISIAISISLLGVWQVDKSWVIYANDKKDKQEFSDVITEQYKKELNLVLPDVIDDPAYKVVFSNPSKDKPVDITIDSREFKKVKSPFTLPNLSLGTHLIVFKFTNKDGIPRTLSMSLTVVPKEPVIDKTNKTLFTPPNPIEIKGKAMAFSKVMVIINGSNVQYTNVDANGNWTFLLKTPKQGVYKFMFFTYNQGIISKKYAYLKVEYRTSENNTAVITPTKKPIKERVITLVNNYQKELMALGLVFAGIALVILAIKIRKYFKKKWEVKEIAELINSNRPKSSIDEVVKDLQKEKVIKGSSKGTDNESSVESKEPSIKKIKKTRQQKKAVVKNKSKKQTSASKHTIKKAHPQPKKRSKPSDEQDITELVFEASPSRKMEKTKKQSKDASKSVKKSVKTSQKTSSSKKTSKKKTSKTNTEQPASEVDIKIDKKELSKDEFLGLFKKSKK